jgi:hypothetical protein
MGASDKAYAATVEAPQVLAAGTSVTASILPNFTEWNPFEPITNTWDSFISWIKEVPHDIAEWSVSLMADLYELVSNLILKTPLWIFDNEWFHNTTYQFSMFSIGIVSVLTIVESIKRMLSGVRGKRASKPMEMKDIMKRWGIVAGVITSAPYIFQKAFQGLNWLSDKIVSMGGDTMRAVSAPENIAGFDVLTLLIFDILLVATIVPVLWKNGRRFFDIMVLGVISPFALTAWIFDSYRHYFNQWWDNLKHLSLVQVYYAIFLLMLGWFIFGVPTPESFTGIITKMLVVIGGFARMVNPPRIISKHLDNGGGFGEVFKGTSKAQKGFKHNVDMTKDILSGPTGWVKRGIKAANPEPTIITPEQRKTRMGRIHGAVPTKGKKK